MSEQLWISWSEEEERLQSSWGLWSLGEKREAFYVLLLDHVQYSLLCICNNVENMILGDRVNLLF